MAEKKFRRKGQAKTKPALALNWAVKLPKETASTVEVCPFGRTTEREKSAFFFK
jgi:hypothetical protein